MMSTRRPGGPGDVTLVMSLGSVSDDDYKFETEFVVVESDRRELTRTSSLLRATLAASTSAKLLVVHLHCG